MFSMSEDERELLVDRIQSVPTVHLEKHMLNKKVLSLSKKFLEACLQAWKHHNAQYSADGRLLAKSNKNRLATYFGLQPTNNNIDQVEPWQVCDHYLVDCNLDLLLYLTLDPRRDTADYMKRVMARLGKSTFWALAICHFSACASTRSLINSFLNFTTEYYVESLNEELKTNVEMEPMRKAFLAEEKRRKAFVRLPDKQKAQILREKADAYHKKHQAHSRDYAAQQLARDGTIGIRQTRIKEYFNDWYSPQAWPRGKTGPKSKPT